MYTTCPPAPLPLKVSSLSHAFMSGKKLPYHTVRSALPPAQPVVFFKRTAWATAYVSFRSVLALATGVWGVPKKKPGSSNTDIADGK